MLMPHGSGDADMPECVVLSGGDEDYRLDMLDTIGDEAVLEWLAGARLPKNLLLRLVDKLEYGETLRCPATDAVYVDVRVAALARMDDGETAIFEICGCNDVDMEVRKAACKRLCYEPDKVTQ